MFVTRKNAVRIAAPIALVGALFFTGCSANADAEPTDSTTAAVQESDLTVGTGVTSMEDVRWGLIDSADLEFNSAVEELVLKLNAASPGGLFEVNINSHGPQLVSINLLTDSDDGTISASQVTATVDALLTWKSPVPVEKFEIGGFNQNFGEGEILTGAAEAGINEELLEDMWGKVVIPADMLNAVYA